MLRQIANSDVDDSQYIHALSYADLNDEQFKELADDQASQLARLLEPLRIIAQTRAVPTAKLRSALTTAQFNEYRTSFDFDISHVESAESHKEAPPQLHEYMEFIRQGDKHTRTANMFKRSRKLGPDGQTAFGRYESKAESCYEQAVFLLCNMLDTNPARNPIVDIKLANEIAAWLDRPVDPTPGQEPGLDAENVPRVRGTRSRYTQSNIARTPGTRFRKYWRQREAVTSATLALLYDPVERPELSEQQRLQLKMQLQRLKKMD